MKGHKIANSDALAFILGGKARFTFKSLNTGNDFSYEVKNAFKRDANGKKVPIENLKFVSLFIGANQRVKGRAYAYMGYLTKTKYGWEFRQTEKSKVLPNDLAIISFQYVFNNLLMGRFMPTLEIWHEGTCCCCGKELKLSESIELGWGPVCLGRRKGMLELLKENIEERRQAALFQMELLKQRMPKQKTSTVNTLQANLFNNLPDLITKK